MAMTEYYNGLRIYTLEEPKQSFWDDWIIPSLHENGEDSEVSKYIEEPLPIMLTGIE
jgi:hypothetical protein